MFKKIFNVNLLVLAIFLWGTVFPSSLFSYETLGQSSQDEKIDESLDYTPGIFKKVRCPRCDMELYYVPGKEGPHAHWVQYEVPKKEGLEQDIKELESRIEQEEEKEQADASEFINLFKMKKGADDIKKLLSEKKRKASSLGQLYKREGQEYELRQRLNCPYDGYTFFPEQDVIEDRKLIDTVFSLEKPSVIETSFAHSIPFGISKELKQFGYDLFEMPEEQEKKERMDTAVEKNLETLSAISTLGLLKNAISPTSPESTLSFQASSQTAVVPVSPDYVVGPGDTLVINIWGSVQESFPVEVDREGKIMLPKAGPLYIWGLELKEAEARIKQRLNQHYTNFYMDLSMGKLRDIQVYVMGDVKKPGTYKISSQASIFQALYAAGGPTKLGSLRRVKLIHTDGKDEEIDLYPFLLQGKMINPAKVQSGDTIFVPSIGDVVAIAGNVKRPAIYETKSIIPLEDLLGFAGGIIPTGDLQRLQVERIHNNEKRVMFDIELERKDLGKFSLENINMQSGDIVIVSPIVRLKHDFVSIVGNVERPGDYALSKDMSVTDLIKRAKGFLPATYLQRGEIARVTKDRARQIIPVDIDSILLGKEEEDMLLSEWDIFLVYSESQIQPPVFAEVDGAVNRPGKYELTPKMKISDLIFRAGGVKPGEVIKGAELFHIVPEEQPVVVEIGIRQMSGMNIIIDKDIILRAGDAIFVKSEPSLTERKIVSINGEVRFPGTYSIREGERLSSLIERAGGFTEEAFLKGTVFARKSIKEVQEKMRQRFIEREQRTLMEEQQAILLRAGGVASADVVTQSVKARMEMMDMISQADIEGRMVITLLPVNQLKHTKYDIPLEDGDMLTIPQPASAITVIGSVNNPTSVPFEEGKGIGYYIQRTGGTTKHADRSGIYVVRANGEAINKFMMTKFVERGDTIVVPQEFKYWTPPGTLLKDTVEMLSRIAVGVGIIAALQ